MTRGRGSRFWWGAGAGLAVLIVLLGWFAAISPQLSAATTARSDAEGLRLQNQVLRASVAKLEQQRPGPLRASLAAEVAALPYQAELPALTRQLTVQAQQHHVVLDSIVVGSTTTVGGVAGDSTGTAGGTSTGTTLAIPITLSSTGAGDEQRAFLQAIQVQGPRRALVTAIQLSPSGGDDGTIAGRSTMTTSMTAFVSPLTVAAETQLERLLRGGTTS